MQPPGRQLSQQRKAEGLRRAVTASDEAITRYSRQIDAMATGLSRLIKRLDSIELRLNRAGKRDPRRPGVLGATVSSSNSSHVPCGRASQSDWRS
jgi:septal ring factor EnvC (AmiA/AmiB activator)